MSNLDFEKMTLDEMISVGTDVIMKSFDDFVDKNTRETLKELLDLGLIDESNIGCEIA